MIQFKLCMIGAYAVGKTSLVERYVRSIYSDEYHTTIGVKIDKKEMLVNDIETQCMIWDIAGEDEFYTVNNSYLRGMSGYFLVMDGTRLVSLDIARKIQARIELNYPGTPFVLIANKSDLVSRWVLSDGDMKGFSTSPYTFIKTSAKTGEQVEEAFQFLINEMLEARGSSNV